MLGSFAAIEPETLVRNSDIIVAAQILSEDGMVNEEEFYNRNGESERFTADTQWSIQVYDVLKNTTHKNLTNETLQIITPGAKEATMHTSTDFELGEVGEYVLLFLVEQVDENNEVVYRIGTPQRIMTLQQVHQGDREKTLQYNNVKDIRGESTYYLKCFNEIQRWIRNIESKAPIYISKCVTGGNYEIRGFIKNNYTYIALKDLEEVFWVQVKWDAKTHTILINNENTAITLVPNSKKAVINKMETTIDIAPIVEDGKSYLPMRTIAKILGKEMSCTKQGNIYKYDMK